MTRQFNGYPAIRLKNDRLSLDIIPNLGGKIISLTSAASGKEWLWRNLNLEYRTALESQSYTELHDTGGIDECFPSVDACVLPESAGYFAGISLPDHGELFGRPWSRSVATVEEDGRAILKLQHDCQTIPVTFERTLILPQGDAPLTINYRLVNNGVMPVPFSWCMHPALQVTPGMRILVPDGHQVHCSYATPGAPVYTGETFNWPIATSGINLTSIPETAPGAGFAAKLLSSTNLNDIRDASEPAMIGIENPATAERLLFSFLPEEIPHIALWLNCGGWAPDGITPYFNLVMEPAIGNADSLSALLSRKTAPKVPPNSTRSWSLQLDVQ
ncbi:DUF5107 domain-containing protein [Microbulbifer sp. YPW1]|uniref:DUF5107 domain-containing protein n=1 Tax=Microbulbifer sp. YPW1 TaxID=2745199 RepID=UPI0015986417|nr:DUF5107 domain-containing protein [Microbulbifer sp. YPW1]QKX17586.1 DUF5107 domain-containing protein [Microbulbifer sp. YPW1]